MFCQCVCVCVYVVCVSVCVHSRKPWTVGLSRARERGKPLWMTNGGAGKAAPFACATHNSENATSGGTTQRPCNGDIDASDSLCVDRCSCTVATSTSPWPLRRRCALVVVRITVAVNVAFDSGAPFVSLFSLSVCCF